MALRRMGMLVAVAMMIGTADEGAVGAPAPATRPADLADQVAGNYRGDVISDARGSSRSEVRIIVTKIGPNRVRIASDYPRLPSFEAALGRYMSSIQNVGGDQVFLYDTGKTPPSLDITVDDASWSGTRE